MTDNPHSTDTEEAKIAVTGGAGFIGSRVLERLQATHPEWELVAIDNQYLGQVSSVGDVDIDHVDVRNRRRLEASLDGADVVLHLAALSGVDDCQNNPDLGYEVNVTGTNNVGWLCRKSGAALVFPFSMAVLGAPSSFPVTADLPRRPGNWYARTKYLGERAIETFAEDAFPAHLFMKSNLYGEHVIGDTVVSKRTVLNFFSDRAKSGEPLTVHQPGTQTRNFVHVKDVAEAYVRSTERLLGSLARGETGTETYEIASDEHYSVMELAALIESIGDSEFGMDVDVTLVENPRPAEAFVDEFPVDTSRTRSDLGWETTRSVEESIRDLLGRSE